MDNWGDVGGPVQLDFRKAVLIGLHHALDPCNTDIFGPLQLVYLFPLFTSVYVAPQRPHRVEVRVLANVFARINPALCVPLCYKVTEHFSESTPLWSAQTHKDTRKHTLAAGTAAMWGGSTEAHFTHTD